MERFDQLNLKADLQTRLADQGFEVMTTVQSQVIPQALAGEDLIVESQTGSGKTLAFMIPIIEAIDPAVQEVQAVVTAPSRELAQQLYQVATSLVDPDGPVRISLYIGGTDKQRQIQQLDHQQPHLVIGTPGRIFDLMSDHALWVQTSRILVVDEADMTLDLGFLSVLDEIASRMPQNLQMMAFSATVPQELEVFLNKYMQTPQRVKIDEDLVLSPTIKNYLIQLASRDPKELVYELLTLGNPYLALVFVNTREAADEYSQYLRGQGLKVATIHGGIEPRERNRTMRQIRQLDFQYIVATDLAARGIDIPGVSHVINVELPQDLEFFVHRVGRTGRNNLEGEAYTLMYPGDDADVAALERKGVDFIPVRLVDGELVNHKDRNQRKNRQDTARPQEDPDIRRMINQNKKKKVKPGYKRKLKHQIKEKRRTNAKQKARQARRQSLGK